MKSMNYPLSRKMLMPAACVVLVLAPFFSSGLPARAEDRPTPVFNKLRYGIFVHHGWGGHASALTKNPDLSVPKSIDELAGSFDIPKFVRDIQAFNPEYLTLTAWHAEMNPIFPSPAMEKWRGPGHDAKRDVIAELIKELKPTGIKLFLYIHPSDGHDMSRQDQEALGWNESQGDQWAPGKFVKWNDFMNDVFGEMCARYGRDISGYWVDGGWGRIDKARLQNTAWKYNPDAEFVSGMDNSGWCNQFNQICPPDPAKGIPAADPIDGDTWPSFTVDVNLIEGGSWWSVGQTAKMSPVQMLRYTVLQAGTNTTGGGVGWAADPYTDGTWEPNVREYLSMLGQLITPIQESIKNTYASTSFITPQGSRIATLPRGIVATRSADNQFEYVHVLRPPTKDATWIWNLELPPPADFKKFTRAVLLRSGHGAKLTQDDNGVHIGVPYYDCWDPIDTVIKLTVQPGSGLKSQGKKVTMSGPEVPGWPVQNAVDGDKNTGWSSPPVQPGEAPWIMIDLGDLSAISRVHLFPRIQNGVIGFNFPVDFDFSVSADGQSFTKVLDVADHKVTSPRNESAKDLALSAVGAKSPADYPQYFVLPAGTRGRYLKITGHRFKDEQRMQFMDIEVIGSAG
jgi:hypothetical protein